LAGSTVGVAVAASGLVVVVGAMFLPASILAGSTFAVSFLGVSLLLASGAGAAATSDGLVSAAFSVTFAASDTGAAVSGLKSLTVGGGRLAGSGRGIAASIASSAALLPAEPV
jgi:hypothetical protein